MPAHTLRVVMHHNDIDYWRHLQSLPPGHADLPSPRECRLLQRTAGSQDPACRRDVVPPLHSA